MLCHCQAMHFRLLSSIAPIQQGNRFTNHGVNLSCILSVSKTIANAKFESQQSRFLGACDFRAFALAQNRSRTNPSTRVLPGPLATECDIALWIVGKLQFATFAESGQKGIRNNQNLCDSFFDLVFFRKTRRMHGYILLRAHDHY